MRRVATRRPREDKGRDRLPPQLHVHRLLKLGLVGLELVRVREVDGRVVALAFGIVQNLAEFLVCRSGFLSVNRSTSKLSVPSCEGRPHYEAPTHHFPQGPPPSHPHPATKGAP